AAPARQSGRETPVAALHVPCSRPPSPVFFLASLGLIAAAQACSRPPQVRPLSTSSSREDRRPPTRSRATGGKPRIASLPSGARTDGFGKQALSQAVRPRSKPVNPGRRVVEDRPLLLGAEIADSATVGLHQARIVGPELLDRKVGAEEAALGAEERDGVVQKAFHVGRIIAVNEGAKA